MKKRLNMLLGVAGFALAFGSGASAQNAYIGNQDDNTISVINTATNSVTTTIPGVTDPYAFAVNPAGTFLYVVSVSGRAVYVINTATNSVLTTVPVGNNPIGIAINPAGTFAY